MRYHQLVGCQFFYGIFAFSILLSIDSVAANAGPPNIVHIVADDLGWNDVGFHGSEIKTPILDALALDSVVLDRFYVTPICSPTRAGLLTGRYPFRFGIWGGVCSPDARHGLPPIEQTTPELLKEAGYHQRAMFGKWHLGLASTKFHPLNHGFTDFYGHYNGAIDYFSRKRFGQLDWHRDYESVHEEGYSTDLLGTAAVNFIESATDENPFYMYVALNAPHSPIQAKRSDLKSNGFDPNEMRALNTDQDIARRENAPDYGERGRGNTVRQTFAAMVSSLDENVGLIINAIDRKGIRDNTIVIFHSDNGGAPQHGGDNRPLRGNKFTTWEGGVRAVGLIRWPARLQGGTTYESVAAYIDILPTLAAAAGIPAPPDIDGINLLPFLEGEQAPPKRSLLLAKDAIVSDQWKLKGDKFYDLKRDPEETTSVSPPKKVAELLRTELGQFSELEGSQTVTALPRPTSWPPRDWKLPYEHQVK